MYADGRVIENEGQRINISNISKSKRSKAPRQSVHTIYRTATIKQCKSYNTDPSVQVAVALYIRGVSVVYILCPLSSMRAR